MATILDEGSVEILAKAIQILADTQKLIKVGEHSWEGLPTKDDVRQYGFALCGEVHELCDELHWKAWQLPKPVNPLRVKDEHADVLAFLGILVQYSMQLADLGPMELAEAYHTKTMVNLERVAGKVQGYGNYKVQNNLMGPKQLQVGWYYNVVDTSHNWNYHALLEAYDEGLDLYNFRDILNGATQRLVGTDPTWRADAVAEVAKASDPAAVAGTD